MKITINRKCSTILLSSLFLHLSFSCLAMTPCQDPEDDRLGKATSKAIVGYTARHANEKAEERHYNTDWKLIGYWLKEGDVFTQFMGPSMFNVYKDGKPLNVFIMGVYHTMPFGALPTMIQGLIDTLLATQGSTYYTEIVDSVEGEESEAFEIFYENNKMLLNHPSLQLNEKEILKTQTTYLSEFPLLAEEEMKKLRECLKRGWSNSLSSEAMVFFEETGASFLKPHPKKSKWKLIDGINPYAFEVWISSIYSRFVSFYGGQNNSSDKHFQIDAMIEHMFQRNGKKLQQSIKAMEGLVVRQIADARRNQVDFISGYLSTREKFYSTCSLGAVFSLIQGYVSDLKALEMGLENGKDQVSSDIAHQKYIEDSLKFHQSTHFDIGDDPRRQAYFSGQIAVNKHDIELDFRNNVWLKDSILPLLKERSSRPSLPLPPSLIVFGNAHTPVILKGIREGRFEVYGLTNCGGWRRRH